MRISETGTYPYPVLREDTVDFENGKIEFSCSYKKTDDVINFEIESKINEDAFLKYIKDKRISAIIEIECEDTYLCRYEKIEIGSFTVSCPISEISGRVVIRLFLTNSEIIKDYFSEDFL